MAQHDETTGGSKDQETLFKSPVRPLGLSSTNSSPSLPQINLRPARVISGSTGKIDHPSSSNESTSFNRSETLAAGSQVASPLLQTVSSGAGALFFLFWFEKK